MLGSILSNPLTLGPFLVCLITALILGLLTALVFSYNSRHSAGFSLTLALVPMIVTVVIMMVNGNIGAGVAVAGAFALIRFRSVPGSAREIAAIFTAMAIGLATGMGYIGVALLFFITVSLFALLLTRLNFGGGAKTEKTIKITLPENYDYDGLFDEVFEKYKVDARLDKIRTANMGTLYELSYQAVFPDEKVPKEFMDELRARNGNLGIAVGSFTDHELL